MVKSNAGRGAFNRRTQVIDETGLDPAEGMRQKTILAIDDDPDILDIYVSVLGKTYTVITADSGKDALKKQSYSKPDLIIMDVMMEGPATGLKTAVTFKENGVLKYTPLLFVTCVNKRLELDGSRKYAQIAAECEWLSKPVRPKLLLEKIAEILGNQPSL